MDQTPEVENEKLREMTLVGHLGELRRRIVISVIALVAGTLVAYFFVDELMKFVTDPAGKLYFMSPAEGFFSYLKLAVFAGFMLALPVVLWQVWAFVAPALTSGEKKWAIIMVPGSVLLFFSGVAFAYLMVWPAAIKFFLGFGSESLQPMLSLGQYLSFLISFILPFGIIFNLPLGLLIAAKMGIISSAFLAKHRRIMVVVAFIAGGIITPTPDIFSQTMMAIPIILLYEASIWAVRILLRK
ncbi:MAG: twin-arginine translocase subunit TatC [Negativicutes bacterium]